jgi:hypothetical protein
LLTAFGELGLKTIVCALLAIAGEMKGKKGNGNVVAEGETGVVLMTWPFWVQTCTLPEMWHSPEATPAVGCPGAGAAELGVDDVPELVLERVGFVGLNVSLGAVPPSAGAAGSGGGDVPEFTAALGAGDVPEFTAALGAGDAPEFAAESGAGDAPELVLARSGLEPESTLGAGMDGCGTSGGIGVESIGNSADTGELGCGLGVVAATGGDIVALGCGVGVAEGVEPLLA